MQRRPNRSINAPRIPTNILLLRFILALREPTEATYLSNFVNIVQHAAGNANDKNFQVAPGSVFDAARHVNGDAFGESDGVIIELHFTLALDDVIYFVGALVVVEFGVGDFEMMNFGGRLVLLFEEAANFAAGFDP